MSHNEENNGKSIYKTVFQYANDAFLIINPREEAILDANDNACRLLGYTQEELLTEVSPFDIHPHEREQFKSFISRVNVQGEGWTKQLSCLTKNGFSVPAEISASVLNYQGNNCIFVSIRDITKQRKLSAYYEKLTENAPFALLVFDENQRIIDVNNKAVELFGASDKKQLIGKSYYNFVPHHLRETVEQRMQDIIGGKGVVPTREGEIKQLNGESRTVNVIGKAVRYDHDDAYISIMVDISEKERLRKRVIKDRANINALINAVGYPLILTDHSGQILLVNKATEQIGKHKVENLQGAHISDLFEGFDATKRLMMLTKAILRREPITGEVRFGERIFRSTVYPVTDKYGAVSRLAVFAFEITELKEWEKRMNKALKEREMLLSEIHHRVKNNLAVISGMLQLQAMNESDENIKFKLSKSQHRVQSIAKIHEHLYQRAETSTIINMQEYLRELVDTIDAEFIPETKQISVNIDCQEIVLPLSQAIPVGLISNELITNALKHAFKNQDQGTVTVQLKDENSQIKLIIEDNGVGMPKNLSEYEGLGQELINAQVDQLEGDMDVTTAKNEGTKFVIAFEREEVKEKLH